MSNTRYILPGQYASALRSLPSAVGDSLATINQIRIIPPAALPPDVRKASGLPARFFNSFRATPQIQGVAPRVLVSLLRKGRAFPHIKRHSRTHHNKRYRTASGSDRPRPNLSRSIPSLLLRPLLIPRGSATAHCGKPSAFRNDSWCFRGYASARRRSLLINSDHRRKAKAFRNVLRHSREHACDKRLIRINRRGSSQTVSEGGSDRLRQRANHNSPGFQAWAHDYI